MKKITISVKLTDEQKISINNGEKEICVDPSNGTLKASEVFTIFDNGNDVVYECNETEKVPDEGKNLSSEESMYNDCLNLICSIVESINAVINDIKKNEPIDTGEKSSIDAREASETTDM